MSPLGIAIVAAVVIVDQAAKVAALSWLPPSPASEIVPGLLALYPVRNTGIAFSFLTGGGVLVVALTVVIAAVVVAYWARAKEGGRPATVGFALIVGGAIGNLIDRVRLGSVVDFLFLHVGAWSLFVFNLADVALTFGPILLIIVFLLPAKE